MKCRAAKRKRGCGPYPFKTLCRKFSYCFILTAARCATVFYTIRSSARHVQEKSVTLPSHTVIPAASRWRMHRRNTALIVPEKSMNFSRGGRSFSTRGRCAVSYTGINTATAEITLNFSQERLSAVMAAGSVGWESTWSCRSLFPKRE